METQERDDFVHALGQTLAFYNRDPLDRMQVSFWVTACSGKPVKRLKAALLEHVKHSKFAPKPADILQLVDNMGQTQSRNQLPPPPTTNCPPEIAAAWQWFIARSAQGSNLEGIFDSKSEIDMATQERYLHQVNHEAHKYSTPDAIPDEFKLPEVWG